MADVEVFTVTDRAYFVGAVAMAATIARHLPGAGITFLDVGLRPDQRAWLADRHRVVDAPHRLHPQASKSFAVRHLDRLGPDGVLVLADADLVATAPWDAYVASARSGALVAAVDPQRKRRFDAWRTMLGVAGPVRPRPYVNTGLVFWSLGHHRLLLDRWADRCAHLSAAGGAQKYGAPAVFLDQDVLNALLMTEFFDTAVDVRPEGEIVVSATMTGCRVRDPRSLSCQGPAGPVRALHSVQRTKPWRCASAQGVLGPAYARILRAATEPEVRASGSDGPLAPHEVVPWLRPGPFGADRLATGLRVGRAHRAATRILTAPRRRAERRRRG